MRPEWPIILDYVLIAWTFFVAALMLWPRELGGLTIRILGLDSLAKVEMLAFTAIVAVLLRNEIVIWIARAGWTEFWTRALIYAIGILLMIGGTHYNAWILKKHGDVKWSIR